jgi:hypothetical protein
LCFPSQGYHDLCCDPAKQGLKIENGRRADPFGGTALDLPRGSGFWQVLPVSIQMSVRPVNGVNLF